MNWQDYIITQAFSVILMLLKDKKKITKFAAVLKKVDDAIHASGVLES
jgi:hypothetical protein